MGVAKKTRKFAAVKRVISKRDGRLKTNIQKADELLKKPKENTVREIPQYASSMFFQYNAALQPPYSVLIDTNFINHSVQNKLDITESLMDCLYAKAIPHITDCIMAELEKLGPKYRIALRMAKDPRFERLRCDHKVYGDDCLIHRLQSTPIYLLATNDRDLKRRARKIPGVPILSVAKGKYIVERLPDAPEK